MFENAHFINMAFDAAVPYNDLPLLPPHVPVGPDGALDTAPELSNALENTAVLKSCIQARATLAEVNQMCIHFPNQPMLWKNFLMLEACASGKLDGFPIGIEDMFKLSADAADTDTNAARVLAIKQSLSLGYELTREEDLSVSVLLELCSAVERSPMPVRRVSSSVVADTNREEIVYTPPVGAELIQRLLGNWERFIHVDAGNLDPLVIMAIAHYQLDAIQPFSAANGTVARLVDYLLLAEENLLSAPVLELSDWYYQNLAEYQRLQAGVTQQQNWHEWILFVLKGVTASAQKAASRLRTLSELIQHTDAYINARCPKMSSRELTEVIFTDPCVRIQNLVERDIARRQTASVYLKNLCEIGVLSELPFGKEKLFVHQKLLRVLTEDNFQFAQYAE